MLRSSLFQVEADVEITSKGVSHATISCLQWRSPNLAPLEVAAKQSLALMWYGTLDDQVCDVIEQAHLHGALAPVSMIKVRAYKLHLFLADEVSSKTLPAIEAVWEKVKEAANVQSWAVHFSNVSEIVDDRSDDDFCTAGKEILWLYHLGLADFDSKVERSQLLGDRAPVDVSALYLPERMHHLLRKGVCGSHDQIIDSAEALSIDNGESRTQLDDEAQDDPWMLVSPRSLCMLELLLAGVRPQELRRMRIGDVVSQADPSHLRVKISKARLPVQLALGHETRGRLLAYIRASGLCDENYLFPSRGNPNKRMRESELLAFSKLSRLTRATVREAMLDRFVTEWIGHTQSAALKHYLKPDG